MLYAPNGKNLALPIVLNPPLPGRFVGRMQYAPTRDNEKRKMNDEKIRNQAKLAGIPDALIFFSLPFLVSRQEKDVGGRGQRPFPRCYMRRTVKIWPFLLSCTRLCRVVCGAYAFATYPDGRKWGIQQTCIRPCRGVCGAYSIRPYPGQQKTKDEQQKRRIPGQIGRHP